MAKNIRRGEGVCSVCYRDVVLTVSGNPVRHGPHGDRCTGHMHPAWRESLGGHRLSITRHMLGRQTYGSQTMVFGTCARCSCGDWRTQINEYSPSKGGTEEARRRFETQHLVDLARVALR